MKIEHLALWTSDLEKMRTFYTKYFGGTSNSLYHNSAKNFTSYFITFNEGCRLELMHKPEIPGNPLGQNTEVRGITHFAFSVGSKETVDQLTQRLAADGYTISGQPRTTGDGYYESVILDPEGNRVEITE